jgi:uroporphyrinogen decarboxylase
MDLSVEANALGRYTLFPRAESATVVKDTFEEDELDVLQKINIKYDTRLLGYVETLKLMSVGLPSSILRGAYITGPYTLAGLIMGADIAAMATVMHPRELHRILQFTTSKIMEYIRLIIASDVQIICVLEPSAVMLGPDQFKEFSGKYVKYITENCKYTGIATVYHICGNSMHLIDEMVDSGIDGISLDSSKTGVNMLRVAKKLPDEVILIGNIDPVGALLNGTPQDVENEVNELLEKMDPFPNFVLSTGCDLPQETKIENILTFMKAGRNYKVKS